MPTMRSVILTALFAVVWYQSMQGQLRVFGPISDDGDRSFIFDRDLSLLEAVDWSLYNGVDMPKFIGLDTLVFGRQGGLTYGMKLSTNEWWLRQGFERTSFINVGQDYFAIFGVTWPWQAPPFVTPQHMYLVDRSLTIIHTYDYSSMVDSGQDLLRSPDVGYYVSDSSYVICDTSTCLEFLTDPPYAMRRLEVPVLTESYWTDRAAGRALVSNPVVYFPACDSIAYARVHQDTVIDVVSMITIASDDYRLDTFDLDIIDVRSFSFLGLGLVSYDTRWRAPPACVVDLSLDSDASTDPLVVGDYRQVVRCADTVYTILDRDASLESNGGRVAYIDIHYDLDGCLEIDVTGLSDSLHRVADTTWGLRIYPSEQSDYTLILEELSAIRVQSCIAPQSSMAEIEISIVLTSGQEVSRHATYDLSGIVAEPDILMEQVNCVLGSIDTVAVVSAPGSVTASTSGAASGQSLIIPCVEGSIEYTIADASGCEYDRVLEVVPYVPTRANVFSPNGDQRNEVFDPCYGVDCSFVIYDQWGSKVYEGVQGLGWQGLYRGQPASPGVYLWLVESPAGGQRGTVTLIR